MAASVARSIPASAIRVANVWRKSYRTKLNSIPAFFAFVAEIVVRVVQARDVLSGVAIGWKYPRRFSGHPRSENPTAL